MTTYSFPFQVDSFTIESRAHVLTHSSPYSGYDTSTDMATDRWYAALSIPLRTSADGAAVEAWIAKMRGMANRVELWHMGRPVPRGTMRGSPTVSSVAVGASSFNITTTASATLEAGDMIGFNGELYMVAAYAQADGGGTMAVTIANRVRTAVSTSTAVTWDRPKAEFMMLGSPVVSYLPGYSSAVSIDFREAV